MVKDYKHGKHFQIKEDPRGSRMAGNTVYLRPEARRIDFIEEFSHWRMEYGDRFLAAETAALKKEVKRRGLKRPGETAEELAIKTYMIENAEKLGIETVDVEFLKNNIKSLWKYGNKWY